jgi:hypothetical protein
VWIFRERAMNELPAGGGYFLRHALQRAPGGRS